MLNNYRFIFSQHLWSHEIYIKVVDTSSHHIQERQFKYFIIAPQMYCSKNNLANKIWCNIGWLSLTREPYLLHGTWNIHVNNLLWQFPYSNSFPDIVLTIFRKWKLIPNGPTWKEIAFFVKVSPWIHITRSQFCLYQFKGAENKKSVQKSPKLQVDF